MLMEPGKYVAELGGKVSIYEAESGALCIALPVRVADGAAKDTMLKHTMTMFKKDATANTLAIDTLKAVFEWDGADPFWFVDNAEALGGIQFSITVETEQVRDEFGNPLEVSKIKWLDPVGGKVLKMPEMADRRSVLAKYGAMFRAIATPSRGREQKSEPGAAREDARPTVPARPAFVPKPLPRPVPVAPVLTVEEVWAAFVNAYGDKAAERWDAAMKGLGLTEEPNAAQCAALKATLAGVDDVPFEAASPAAALGPMLDDATVLKLEATLGHLGAAAATWLLREKWLQPGQGLQHLSRANAERILGRPAQFLRAVKGGAA